MNIKPAPRTETVLIHWVAVEGPRQCCSCGHEHWGWKPESMAAGYARLGAQWGYCSPSCDCTTLVLAERPEPPA